MNSRLSLPFPHSSLYDRVYEVFLYSQSSSPSTGAAVSTGADVSTGELAIVVVDGVASIEVSTGATTEVEIGAVAELVASETGAALDEIAIAVDEATGTAIDEETAGVVPLLAPLYSSGPGIM